MFAFMEQLPNVGNAMDIAEIATKSAIETRRLRYALEHSVVAFGNRVSRGRGMRRQFSDPESFILALAALMLDSGIRRHVVEFVVKDFSTFVMQEKGSLDFPQTGSAARQMYFEIADGVNYRTRDGSVAGSQGTWTQTKTKAELANTYRPMVVITLDVAELHRRLFGGAVQS